MSTREHLLMIVALFVLGGGAYYAFRFRTAWADVDLRTRQIAEVKGKIEKLKWPSETPGSEEGLMTRLDETKASFQVESLAVDELRSTFAPSEDAAIMQGLKLKISELAQGCGVNISKSTPIRAVRNATKKANRRADGARGQGQRSRVGSSRKDESRTFSLESLLTDDYKNPRPREKLEVVSTFEGLSRFVRGLNRLPHQVIIVQFEIAAFPEDPPLNDPVQTLSSELVIIR